MSSKKTNNHMLATIKSNLVYIFYHYSVFLFEYKKSCLNLQNRIMKNLTP